MQIDFFPYGTQYYRYPTPAPECWDADLREISRVGYTHVQFHPQWRTHERIRGIFMWDDLDRLFDLAHEHGLRVGLQPMLETAPDWVFSELGGTRIGFHGIPITPISIGSFYVGGWQPCFHNPQVMDAALEFIRQIAARYKDHPAMWFWSAWNEPRSRPLGECQCEHSKHAYRQWLERRFGAIEDLDAFLGKAWTSYEMLDPPASAMDDAEMFFWRQWAAHSVAERVRLVSETINAVDSGHLITGHVGGCSVLQDVACDASDDILNRACVERYGSSFPVPLHPKTITDHACSDLISDWLRRVDPSFWLYEFYANHGEWCEPPDPKTLNRLLWMALSGGTSSFTYWQFRSERFGTETNGYGMREIDGSPTDRSRVTDAVAGILRLHGAKLAASERPPSRIALMYSRESDLLSRVTEMREMWIRNEDARSDYPYKRAIKGAHALYMSLGETIDFVIPGDDLSRYELLHVTCAEMIDKITAEALKQYVRSGGKLIVEFPFACRDANTWVSAERPNHGLSDMLGCAEASRVIASGEGKDTAKFDGGAIPAKGWRIRLGLRDARVVATWPDGSAAATRHSYGSGVVCTLGASLSLSFSDDWASPVRSVFNRLLADAGVKRESLPDGLWIRRRRGQGYEIWFVFNVSDSTKDIRLPAFPTEVWQGLESAMDETRLTIGPGGFWVAEMPVTEEVSR